MPGRIRLALYAVQTVNLSILANAFSGSAQVESNYKRLQRFLRQFELPYAELAEFVVKMLGLSGPDTLALDRMNWKVGAVDLNILMLSIVYRGIGIPVVWLVLPKAGASDTSERITVMEIFPDLFGAPDITCLLGDHEFIGREWFRFLQRHRIRFQMRLRRDTWFATDVGSLCKPGGCSARHAAIVRWSSPQRVRCGAWNST